jgi:hypothetical protein
MGAFGQIKPVGNSVYNEEYMLKLQRIAEHVAAGTPGYQGYKDLNWLFLQSYTVEHAAIVTGLPPVDVWEGFKKAAELFDQRLREPKPKAIQRQAESFDWCLSCGGDLVECTCVERGEISIPGVRPGPVLVVDTTTAAEPIKKIKRKAGRLRKTKPEPEAQPVVAVHAEPINDAPAEETLPVNAPQPVAAKTMLDYAVECVRRGWHVFPCYPRSKAPAGDIVPHGYKDASGDESVIRGWWAVNPDYNPAIDLGRSNLVVYDFDEIKPFGNLPPTFTVKTGRIPKDGINGIQMYYTGTCKTHGHPGGGGEVRSRGAYVMANGAIHPSGNPYVVIDDRPLAESPEQNEDTPVIVGPAIGTDEQNKIAAYVEEALDEAKIDREIRVDHQGGFKWIVVCPWKAEHTTGNDLDTSSAVIMWPSGKLIYECKHGHCQGIHQWKELRAFVEAKVGHPLVFGEPGGVILFDSRPASTTIAAPIAEELAVPATVAPVAVTDLASKSKFELVDEMSEASIPAFDPSVINGIYADIVELVTRGTTLAPQFAFVIAKTFIGIKMAGKVTFENLDIEPRLITTLIGGTGSGKGAAWNRVFRLFQPEGWIDNSSNIKIIMSADSGPGIKDLFFDPPEKLPVLCYIDEVESLGNKTKDTRNPSILDTIIELADSTSVSRVLAKRGGGTKTKHDARFAAVMCGQDKYTYPGAFAGRTKQGLWDRFYPEYGVAVEAGEMPKIAVEDAFELIRKLDKLDFSGSLTMSPEARERVEKFWAGQNVETRKKVRWKKFLMLDGYMSAFGRGVRQVEVEDVEIAIKVFPRLIAIRRVCFGIEVGDRIGYYLGLIQQITEGMIWRLKRGEEPASVALSRRDYETQTNAYRNNEGLLSKAKYSASSVIPLAFIWY